MYDALDPLQGCNDPAAGEVVDSLGACPFCLSCDAVALGSLRLGELDLRCRDCGTVYRVPTPDHMED